MGLSEITQTEKGKNFFLSKKEGKKEAWKEGKVEGRKDGRKEEKERGGKMLAL